MTTLKTPITVVAAVLLALAATAAAQPTIDGFDARVFKGSGGATMPYRIFTPAERNRKVPLIVYLHGGGGAGDNNLAQISGGNTAGTRLWVSQKVQARHPAFVVAPQFPSGARWDRAASTELSTYGALVVELVASLARELNIDADRVYLMGQSRGGQGTWDLISKRPDVFAAAVPLCGDGNVARVSAARAVAVWAFHGAKDPVIPVAGSRELVAALQAAGGTVKYTEYPDVEHDVWTRAFAEAELPGWLFTQVKKRR